MIRLRPALAGLAAMVAVSACHRRADDPVAVTAEEQAQLNDAAASLDANDAAFNAGDPDGQTDANTEASS